MSVAIGRPAKLLGECPDGDNRARRQGTDGNADRVEHADLELLERPLAQIAKLHAIDKRGEVLHFAHRKAPLPVPFLAIRSRKTKGLSLFNNIDRAQYRQVKETSSEWTDCCMAPGRKCIRARQEREIDRPQRRYVPSQTRFSLIRGGRHPRPAAGLC